MKFTVSPMKASAGKASETVGAEAASGAATGASSAPEFGAAEAPRAGVNHAHCAATAKSASINRKKYDDKEKEREKGFLMNILQNDKLLQNLAGFPQKKMKK
ncbi:MAG: hypothetical protein DCC59_16565 [Chloroflexi bacterium]|nr:hypothetical protein [Anaerolineales bacterium]RIK47234.1 MAG: hypothetical protein DCC59_16565 [Chloroflexota bacterium]